MRIEYTWPSEREGSFGANESSVDTWSYRAFYQAVTPFCMLPLNETATDSRLFSACPLKLELVGPWPCQSYFPIENCWHGCISDSILYAFDSWTRVLCFFLVVGVCFV